MSAVTVIIAAYEAGSTIERAIASTAGVADRVIVVDDGSTDDTGAVAARCGAHVIRQDNAGAASARLRGLDACDTDLLVFLDADDSLCAPGVRRSVEIIDADPTLAAVAGSVVAVYPDGHRSLRSLYGTPGQPVTTADLLQRGVGPWPPAAQVVRRSALLASQVAEPPALRPRYAEDYETVIRLSRVGGIVQHDTPACEYSIFVGKASRSAQTALECKEAIRRHYADADGIDITSMTQRAIRGGAAMMGARTSVAHRRYLDAARRGALGISLKAIDRIEQRVTGTHRAAGASAPASDDTDRPLVVVPWLEGGGAQYALASVLADVGAGTADVVVLFGGCRDFESVAERSHRFIMLDAPRTPLGVFQAAQRVRPVLHGRTRIYSLMRGSHLVLGLALRAIPRDAHLAASFHQLPSTDDADRLGALENILVRRYTRRCELVTTPSERAVEEIRDRRFAVQGAARAEANLIAASGPAAPPRATLDDGHLRLLLAGRLTEQKGLDRIVEILDAVEHPVTLHVAGDGPLRETLLADLSRVADRHDVRYLGRTDGLDEQLDWCDAVLMPSRYELNPIVVWEAWARGRPVVSSRLSVFSDLAALGPVEPAGTPQEWRDAIARLTDADHRTAQHARALAAFAGRERSSDLAAFLRGTLTATTVGASA
ncbi:glycosyltransferase [Sanguibacter antarcticus]|uniref:D-inositol 3-phosphate glycosyltransferase n=1 Tax=Sanguibacter antarcticus TaxID=372484 RepID=A0A2A9E2V7_9MICO|nr:glycosyltransferase [Sanguibacter antarcticus]PFG33184.1 glycosyltransferase involved in cell wall biosynthesis [Sanguibacter antarcticus]